MLDRGRVAARPGCVQENTCCLLGEQQDRDISVCVMRCAHAFGDDAASGCAGRVWMAGLCGWRICGGAGQLRWVGGWVCGGRLGGGWMSGCTET
jgi:hypothetical protein